MSEDEYRDRVRGAAARGYAADEGSSHAGVTSVAAAVAGNLPGYCISASVFAGSRSAQEMAALGEAVRSLAAELGGAPAASTHMNARRDE